MQNTLEGACSRLADLLTEETIGLDLEAADWRDAVRLAGSLLLQTGSIAGTYIEGMIRTVEEIGPYMVVAPGIALAHARPEDGVRNICMSLVRLSSPVEFGSTANDPVDLVFAFGAIDKEAHLQVLRELAMFLQDEETIAAFRRCGTVGEAVQLVNEYSHSSDRKLQDGASCHG
jgi:mannitol operon transcriptional antiterminator